LIDLREQAKETSAATWNAAALLPWYRYTLFHELPFGMVLCFLPTFHLLGDPRLFPIYRSFPVVTWLSDIAYRHQSAAGSYG